MPDFSATVSKKLRKAAALSIPVVLCGERGTGKTMLAHYYHENKGPRQKRALAVGARKPKKKNEEKQCVHVSLSELPDVKKLRGDLFGWNSKTVTDVQEDSDGLIGEAHEGTLFLDEIHHLPKELQAALLKVMNDGTYRPEGERQTVQSNFDLVVATNDSGWEQKLAADFRDRIAGKVLKVPSFRKVVLDDPGREDLWRFFDILVRRKCHEKCVSFPDDPDCKESFIEMLKHKKKHQPPQQLMPGNWRDLERLVDQVLMEMVQDPYGKRVLEWDVAKLKEVMLGTLPGLALWHDMGKNVRPRRNIRIREPKDE